MMIYVRQAICLSRGHPNIHKYPHTHTHPKNNQKTKHNTQDRALAGTRKVVTLFQKMNVAFTETDSVMSTLPGEMVYLDTALGIASGTELRRWTLKCVDI
jgi:hypothetical protein